LTVNSWLRASSASFRIEMRRISRLLKDREPLEFLEKFDISKEVSNFVGTIGTF
jgi:hypothetical protein